MYESIHTTVYGPGGRRYEVQIRTREMHRTAEYGIAAHWRYKAEGKESGVDDALTWFRQVLEWQKDASEPDGRGRRTGSAPDRASSSRWTGSEWTPGWPGASSPRA